MKVFKTIFSIQSKKFFTKRNICVFLFIGLILILLVQDGKNKYLTGIENIKEFQAMEAEKVKFFVYYDQYANYGIKILFYAKSHLPYNFGLGVFLTPFYTVLLLLLSFRSLKKKMKVPEPKNA